MPAISKKREFFNPCNSQDGLAGLKLMLLALGLAIRRRFFDPCSTRDSLVGLTIMPLTVGLPIFDLGEPAPGLPSGERQPIGDATLPTRSVFLLPMASSCELELLDPWDS